MNEQILMDEEKRTLKEELAFKLVKVANFVDNHKELCRGALTIAVLYGCSKIAYNKGLDNGIKIGASALALYDSGVQRTLNALTGEDS